MATVDKRLQGRPSSIAGVKLLMLLGPLYMRDIVAIELEVEKREQERALVRVEEIHKNVSPPPDFPYREVREGLTDAE